VVGARKAHQRETDSHRELTSGSSAKGRDGRTHESSLEHSIRFGIRTPDGTTVMGLTDSEKHQRRAEEMANIIADKQARKDKLTQMVHAQMAVTDNWANKNAGTDYV